MKNFFVKITKTGNKKAHEDYFENDDTAANRQSIRPIMLLIAFIVGFGVALIIFYVFRIRLNV